MSGLLRSAADGLPGGLIHAGLYNPPCRYFPSQSFRRQPLKPSFAPDVIAFFQCWQAKTGIVSVTPLLSGLAQKILFSPPATKEVAIMTLSGSCRNILLCLVMTGVCALT
ncbi:MAG: hypothetical protein PVG72_09005, partial [Gammaproteobacteria bacterium]